MLKKMSLLIALFLFLGIIASCDGSSPGGGGSIPGMPTTGTGTIEGTVTDANTLEPISNASISLDSGQSATSESNGTFTITNAPSGYRLLMASKTNYYSSSILVTVTGNQTKNVDIALMPSGSSEPPEPPATDKDVYAVLAGIEDYPGTSCDLNYCVDDVNDIKSSLQSSSSWSNAKIVTLTNSNATKENIKNAIQEASSSLKSNGLFVFFYSGHGSNSQDTGSGYIVNYDGVSTDGYGITSKMISETELEGYLNNLPSTIKKVILIDACHSGSFIDQRTYEAKTGKIKFIPSENSTTIFYGKGIDKSLTSISNMVCITACAGSETCSETSSLQNGVFTYYVVQGLGSGSVIGPADTNSSASISAEEIYNYTAPRAAQYNSGQNAKIKDNYSGDLLIKY